MKKRIIFLILIILLISTGCVKKEKLTCTQEEKITAPVNVSIESKSVIKFEDGYATEFNTNQVLNFDNEDNAKTYIDSFESDIGYKLNRKGSKVTIDYSKKIDKENIKTEENKKDYIKKYLEDKNYKCK
jgi:hypothetical protein